LDKALLESGISQGEIDKAKEEFYKLPVKINN